MLALLGVQLGVDRLGKTNTLVLHVEGRVVGIEPVDAEHYLRVVTLHDLDHARASASRQPVLLR